MDHHRFDGGSNTMKTSRRCRVISSFLKRARRWTEVFTRAVAAADTRTFSHESSMTVAHWSELFLVPSLAPHGVIFDPLAFVGPVPEIRLRCSDLGSNIYTWGCSMVFVLSQDDVGNVPFVKNLNVPRKRTEGLTWRKSGEAPPWRFEGSY
jgi:hypothetical protein